MADFGFYLLLLSFLLAVHATAAGLLGAWRRQPELTDSALRAVKCLALSVCASSLALLYCLITSDFSLAYVARHTDAALPLFYRLSAFWAGQEGSLLFWALTLSVFSALAVHQNRSRNRQLMAIVAATLGGVNLFFISLMVFVTNPFELLPTPMADGSGLNPLLRNPGMVFHPPALLAGYAGFAVPFAFAIGALVTRQLDTTWIRTTRRWTLISWSALTVGILLGAEWAYKVLGWGGYWAWDPVENASLIPWLVGTAYLHSVMIQERKGMLKIWNLVLVILTFELAIFGTFLTRSGVVNSVHSFSGSSLGTMFLTFLLTTFGLSLWLLWNRRHLLRSDNRLEAVLSRESSFLFNNLVLVGIAFAVLLGTVFPVISEAVTGEQITVGPPFYNKVAAPFGLALLVLTGACPLIAWRKASWVNFRNNFAWPLLGSAAVSGVLAGFGVRGWLPMGFFAACTFVMIVTALEFLRGAKARRHMTGENYVLATGKLVLRNRRRYGGFIVHAGTVILFAGIVGSSFFQTTAEGTLARGETIDVGAYTLRFEGLQASRDDSRESVVAHVSVFQGDHFADELTPAKHFYPRAEQPMTAVSIRTTLIEDLYVILNGWEANGTARFRIHINPLATWIWAGGGIMMLGAGLVLWPETRRLPAMATLPQEVACDVA